MSAATQLPALRPQPTLALWDPAVMHHCPLVDRPGLAVAGQELTVPTLRPRPRDPMLTPGLGHGAAYLHAAGPPLRLPFGVRLGLHSSLPTF